MKREGEKRERREVKEEGVEVKMRHERLRTLKVKRRSLCDCDTKGSK